MPLRRQGALLLLAVISASILSDVRAQALSPEIKRALDAISPQAIRAHLKFLSHDLLEGRGTGQRGGEIAALYIATQFEIYGLEPANWGSYFQKVQLVGVETRPESSLEITRVTGPEKIPMKLYDDYVIFSDAQKEFVEAQGDMIFVGYGIVAPEYNWDDYKGADVSGKVLVMLVNDPPSDDPKFFGGRALTYYGRWTYKYEIAAEKKALGAILIHTPESAGYGWEVVRNSWGRERPQVELRASDQLPLQMSGWVTERTARQMLHLAGQDLDVLRDLAARRDFEPIPLGLKARARIASKLRRVETSNVLGLLRGSDPKLRDEVVVYTAHYDHLGVDPSQVGKGDAIYNGAYDNASGVATMLEVARVFSAVSPRPRRSVLFIGIAAEEGGLRGSEYYVRNPVFPLERTVANINLDGVSVLGKTEDVVFLGAERSTLEEVASQVAQQLGFRISPDRNPEQGFFYRSDQFNFAKAGVPAFSLQNGLDYLGRPPEWGRQKFIEYRDKYYHRPSDEYDPSWDMSGAAQIAQIAYLSGWRIAEADKVPQWKPGSEFERARRSRQ